MNLTISLTLDGLVRALRWREHDLAEKAERRYLPPGNADEADDIERPISRRSRMTREHHDDRSGG
jgi:hypothetical protein